MSMVIPIAAGMRWVDISWIVISFDDTVFSLKVPRGQIDEMTGSALEMVNRIVEPGKILYKNRKFLDKDYHPKNYPPPKIPVPVQEASLYSSCGAFHAMMALILANSGVSGVSLLTCKVNVEKQQPPEGHIVILLEPSIDLPDGAIWDKHSKPNLKPLMPGEYNKISSMEKKSATARPTIDLYQVKGPNMMIEWPVVTDE